MSGLEKDMESSLSLEGEKEIKLILSKWIDILCRVFCFVFLIQLQKWEEELDGEHAKPELEGGCLLAVFFGSGKSKLSNGSWVDQMDKKNKWRIILKK